jgi:hypothetical protein
MSLHHRSVSALALCSLATLFLALGGCTLFMPSGTITGTVVDSTSSGSALEGVRVGVAGTPYYATTDILGNFELRAPVGSVTLRFVKADYFFADITVEVTEGMTVVALEEIVAYRPLTSGQYRFVLTWGAEPSDLDSHLFLPLSGGGTDEVYYGDQIAADSSANLDWDDTTSYGPETISITSVNPGTYTYSIYNFSGSPDMGTSGAVVKVYDRTGLIRTVDIASATGSDSERWWKICTFNGTFTWLNQMASIGN